MPRTPRRPRRPEPGAKRASVGRTFLDRALYLPQDWAGDAERRQGAGVPEEVTFATKPELARQMLEGAFVAGVPAAWVTGDEIYGDSPDLRRWLEHERHPYVLAVSCSSPIWHHGRQKRADEFVVSLPPETWGTLSCGAGSRGERLYDWACIQIPYEVPSGMVQTSIPAAGTTARVSLHPAAAHD